MPNKVQIRKHNITGAWEHYNSITKKWETSLEMTNDELFKYYERTKQDYLLSYENDVYPKYTHEIKKTLYSYKSVPEITELLSTKQLDEKEIDVTNQTTKPLVFYAIEAANKTINNITLVARFGGGFAPFNIVWKFEGNIILDSDSYIIDITETGLYNVVIKDAKGSTVNKSIRILRDAFLQTTQKDEIIELDIIEPDIIEKTVTIEDDIIKEDDATEKTVTIEDDATEKTVTIEDDATEKTVTIEDDIIKDVVSTLSLGENNIKFSQDGGNKIIAVYASLNNSWQAISNAPWLTFNTTDVKQNWGVGADGVQYFTIEASRNKDKPPNRIATITVQSDAPDKTISITQNWK